MIQNQITKQKSYKVCVNNGIDKLFNDKLDKKFKNLKKYPKTVLFNFLRDLSSKGLFDKVKDIIV